MSMITLQDKALAHLYKYRYVSKDTVFDAPKEITQDGVATAIGITRPHSCLILGKMVKENLVYATYSGIKNKKRTQKCLIYHLTEWGKLVYEQKKEEFAKNGIEIERINLSLNDCNEDDIKRLTEEEYDNIGFVCVLRGVVLRSQIPKDTPLLMFDGRDKLIISDTSKKKFIALGTDHDKRKWHSMAADWCMEHNDDLCERLYHLNLAGRESEAIRLIKINRYEVLDMYEREAAEIVFDLMRRHEDDCDLAKIATRLAIIEYDFDRAERLINIVKEDDPELAGSMMAELLLMDGQPEKALELARASYRNDCDTGMTLGKCMIENRMYNEAKACLDEVKRWMIENGTSFRIDELLAYEAVIENNLEHIDNALMLIDAAISTSKNSRRKSNLSALSDRMRSEDGILLQCVDV